MKTSYYANFTGNSDFNGNVSNNQNLIAQNLIANSQNSNTFIPTKPHIPENSIAPKPLDYKNLSTAIKSVANSKLISSKYSPKTWNALHIAYNNAKIMNKALNAKTQKQIDSLTLALITAKSKLAKRNVDLKITKVKRSGNSYKITIKNFGKDVSTKTRLKISASDKYLKTPRVKAIAAGKSITLTVKFFKYSQTRSFNKNLHLNYNQEATETNYKNNKFKILKN